MSSQDRSSIRLSVAGRSETGPVRERNEDRFVAARLGPEPRVLDTSLPHAAIELSSGTAPGWLLAVADGMGGHADGDRASALGLLALLAALPDPALPEESLGDGLRRAFRAGSERIREAAPAGANKPMGTTLTAAFVAGSTLLVLHAGDSRAYRLRDGSLERLTRDHTLAQRLIDRGAVTEEEMRRSPLSHQLVSSLGGGSATADPDLTIHDLRPGDRLLLCTDGLSGTVTETEIASCLRNGSSPETTIGELVGQALDRHPRDNVTALVASVGDAT